MAVTDKSNMRKLIVDFPKQFKGGIEAARPVKISGTFDKVLICGVGGSALSAGLLAIWLEEYKIGLPLYVHRDYNLPYRADKDYLIVCISYSGNTEETLSCFDEARRKNMKIAAITSGGKLAQLSKKHKIPLVLMPSGLPPRMTLGFQLAALMQILVNAGVIANGLKNLLALEKDLKPKSLELQGKKLAGKIKGSVPVVYASDRLGSLARIWKIKFNENSKITSFCNYFPELNHNEMVGYTNFSNIHVLILKDEADHPRNKKRMNLTLELLKKRGFPVDIIEIKGKDILCKIFSNLLLADWTSYHLALEMGFDPTPVKIVEDFKKKMK